MVRGSPSPTSLDASGPGMPRIGKPQVGKGTKFPKTTTTTYYYHYYYIYYWLILYSMFPNHWTTSRHHLGTTPPLVHSIVLELDFFVLVYTGGDMISGLRMAQFCRSKAVPSLTCMKWRSGGAKVFVFVLFLPAAKPAGQWMIIGVPVKFCESGFLVGFFSWVF